MSAAPITLRLTPQAAEAWMQSLAQAPSDGAACVLLKRDEVADLIHDARAARELLRLIDTPELVDFPKAVHLEAVHQVQRWGNSDREEKQPYAWFWLISHLATRALEHHKEAERIAAVHANWMADWTPEEGVNQRGEALAAIVAHHREKAVHHTITSAAVLARWHASIIGKHTGMQPGSASAAQTAEQLGESRHG